MAATAPAARSVTLATVLAAGALVALGVTLAFGSPPFRAVLAVVYGVLLVALSRRALRARAESDAMASRLREQSIELEAQRQEARSLTEELGQANADLERAMMSAEGARDVALAGEARMRLIDEASRVLASSLDYETTVARRRQARRAGRSPIGARSILLVDGEIKQLAVAHVDPDQARWARELNAKYPNTTRCGDGRAGGDSHGRADDAVRTSPTRCSPRSARDPEHLAMLRGRRASTRR